MRSINRARSAFHGLLRPVAAIFVFFTLFAAGCGLKDSVRPETPQITVSAAISLKEAFEEIGAEFERDARIRVVFNFGASGVLQQQIESGAPADVFASAGEPQMNALAAKGLILAGSRTNFARNSVVLVVPSDSKLDISSFEQLTDRSIERIAAGNPKTVPAGQYAAQVFRSKGIDEKIAPKLVFGENVRQVLEYVARGEVDAGVVYATDAQLVNDKVRVVAVAGDEAHEPILYPIAIVRESGSVEAARRFIDLVRSEKGAAILSKYGFRPIEGT